MCAVCPNSNQVKIYSGCNNPDVTTWELAYDLSSEHTMLVSGIDWSPVTNKIVTCSHDRNAFVWTYNDTSAEWEPSLVILRINRAALDVKWSPDGKKFAVASGSKCVPICHYEEDNNWWISKMIKKHKSTVLSVDWHPNSQLVATGCCDFKCRVFSAFVGKFFFFFLNFLCFSFSGDPCIYSACKHALLIMAFSVFKLWSSMRPPWSFLSDLYNLFFIFFTLSSPPPPTHASTHRWFGHGRRRHIVW